MVGYNLIREELKESKVKRKTENGVTGLDDERDLQQVEGES